MDGEVDLRPYLNSAWRYRRVIAGATLVAALVVGISLHVLVAPTYEASATLIVTGPRFQVVEGGPPQPQLTVTHVIQLAYTEAVAARTGKRLGISPEVTPRSLLERVAFRPVKETNLLRIVTRDRTRARAADAASAWAAEVELLIDALQRQDAERSLAIVGVQIGHARSKLAVAEQALREFQATSRLAILNERVRESVRRIAAYEARLAEIERGGAPIEGDVSLSPNGDEYRLTVVTPRSAAQLRRVLAGLRLDLARYQVALAEEQERATRLDRQVTVARSTHQLLVQKGEEQRILLGANAGMVYLALPAQASERPVAPRPVRSGVIFGALTLLGTTLGVIIWDARAVVRAVPAPSGPPLPQESPEIVGR